MKRVSGRLTYANVMSTLALFVALGGAGAYAATQLPSRSVGAPQLRPGAVTADKLRKNSVTAPKIKALAIKQGKLANEAFTAAKFANGAITAEKIANGAIGNDKIAGNAVTGDKVDESSLSQVPSAARADSANSAESANPILFARVTAEGTVDSGFSKGISSANVTPGSPGVYCVNVPGFNARGAQVTAEYNVAGNITAYAKVNGGPSCPAPQVEVQTYLNGASNKEPFYIVLYR